MKITLKPVDETNREEILHLSVFNDQPFIATNKRSLEQAEETNKECPGVAGPFGIYADDRLVGFTMFAFDEEYEDPSDRYWLWRFMIDKNEQGKGYGKAALEEIIKYFRNNGADMILLSTEPENERALHVYHKYGFKETGEMNDDEIVLKLLL
jgi:diamine N-acetyltransferase